MWTEKDMHNIEIQLLFLSSTSVQGHCHYLVLQEHLCWFCVIICGQTCKHVFLRLVEQEKDPDFWKGWAQRSLKTALTLQELNKNIAKNVILFLGDGKSHHPWILVDLYHEIFVWL